MKRLCKGRLSLKKCPKLDPGRYSQQTCVQNFINARLDNAKPRFGMVCSEEQSAESLIVRGMF